MAIPLTLGIAAVHAGRLHLRGPEQMLLEDLTGKWVMKGKIAGKDTVHDVSAAWVLNRGYVEIHETSREKNAQGRPRYEATIYVSWDPKKGQFACMWLDTTAVSSFTPVGIGRMEPDGQSIKFVFGDREDGIKTMFSHDPHHGTWSWSIENLDHGKNAPFAKLALTKRTGP